MCRSQPSLTWDLGDRGDTVALRMPLHRTALALLDSTGPLAVTSANRTGAPPATTCDEAEEQLGEAVTVYLDAGPSPGTAASTIVDVTGDQPRVLRMGAVDADRLRVVVPDLVSGRGADRVREYLFVLVMAAAVTYVATPLVRWFAFQVGALAPSADRDMHAEPMPRLRWRRACSSGSPRPSCWRGICRSCPRSSRSGEPQAVLLGAALVCVLGVVDDLRGLDALTKLAGQLLAAGVMAYQGIQLLSLPLFGVTVLPTPVLVALTVLVVVVTINAVNFVDGLDGLAAGIVGIAAVGLLHLLLPARPGL